MLVLEPLPVPELPAELVDPDVVPVVAVVVPEVVLPEVVVPEVVLPDVVERAGVVPVVPDVVVVVVVVPVRSTEPVAMPVDAVTLVDEADGLSLELPPMDPQAERAKAQASETAGHANSRAPAQLTRLNNIHSMQGGRPLKIMSAKDYVTRLW